jgi:NADH-quinone oxidoreductase subunit N
MVTLNALSAVVAVLVTGLVVLIVDLFRPRALRLQLGLTLAGLMVALVAAARVWPILPLAVSAGASGPPVLVVDRFAVFVWFVLLSAAALSVLVSLRYAPHYGLARGEYAVLLALATAAMMLLASANDLVFAFLALETMSIALYVLTAFRAGDPRAQEAGLKYFVLGSFAAAFLLYGAALTFTALGSTNIDGIARALESNPEGSALALAGLLMVVVALGFKLAVVPFHQWLPDVYTGAPAPVTGFMAAATKAAAAAVLIRVLWIGFPALQPAWLPVLGAVAAVTMVAGTLLALVQSDMKRMMGASAIAHAGTILVAVIAGPPDGFMAALYYLLAYGLTSLGVFAVLAALSTDAAIRAPDPGPQAVLRLDASSLDDLRGLGRRSPWLAAALTILLASLAGLPPTAGFLAKWYVFQAATSAELVWLAVIVVLTSAAAAFAYLRPVAFMYFAAPTEEEAQVHVPASGAAAVALPAAFVALALVIGAPFAALARSASELAPAAQAARGGPGGSPGEGPAEGGLMFVAPTFDKQTPTEQP